MRELPIGALVRVTFAVSFGALAIVLQSRVAMSLDTRKELRAPSQAITSNQAPKPAPRRNSTRPGNYYQDLLIYCRDSNDIRTYFCFWMTD